ncbi:benzoate/H(+) symporter BenE family transporter [Lichenihabitans sp. Uapishka_5]|uniref:benzoate/H(+) symporter BenE family transporter n=1 Tax=Lichenihabitans sp. Uapishka_5 TaxID=3037302 RepID=UPI0029E80CF4|nr:benzoate/H(+) symporter BenE family transporter [Lichenihabitans sp. Uapishka_5]MDX7953193.1 benzoate/H(+) symporter BenE family transporter [Lichenihabitans sp. Uapishka_5]
MPSSFGAPRAAASWLQPLSTGLLAALVGFASTFAIILQGLRSVGATPAEAASGLFILCVVQGALAIVYGFVWKQPISIVWSTPGAALLIATGPVAGGFPAATGAFLVAVALIVLAGLWSAFGRLVSSIPVGLAGAMLAGILFEICLAPVHATVAQPALTLPIVLAWALALRFARPYAIPVALLVTVAIVVTVTAVPPGALADVWPHPVFVWPRWSPTVIGTLAVPLFIVTMASQNVPGLAVMRSNGFAPPVGPVFVGTGLGGAVTAAFGGPPVNLAAITAALCAGPDAHPDPNRRYYATVVAGLAYLVLGLFAGVTTAFIEVSPKALIAAVAGLALVSSFAGALATALADAEHRIPVGVTFLVTASGASFFGIGAPFWGLVAGGALMALNAVGRPRANN